MKNRRNYYRILHVQPDAPAAIIKASYRALMQKLRMHPDLGGDEWNAALLNEAYATLLDPARRAAYDKAMRDAGTRRAPAGDRPPGADSRRSRSATGPAASRGDDGCCAFCRTPLPACSGYRDAGDCPGCTAPLQPAGHPALAGTLQRALQRTRHRGTLHFFDCAADHSGRSGQIRDLSPTGLLFASPVPLPNGRVIRIDSSVLAATLRITHCLKDKGGAGYLIGGAFVTLRFHARRGTFVCENA